MEAADVHCHTAHGNFHVRWFSTASSAWRLLAQPPSALTMLRATLMLSALCCAAGFMAPASPLRIAAVSQSSQLDISSEPLPAVLRCHADPPAQPLRQWPVVWLPGENRAALAQSP